MKDSVWSGWGVSVKGPFHYKHAIPNQDAWLIRHFSWGDIAVVSDGMGSKPHSDLGAIAVCDSIVAAFKHYQTNKKADISTIMRLAQAYWLFKISPMQACECSATCLFVACMEEKILIGRLGDGMLAFLGHKQEDCFLLEDDKNNSFSNITDGFSTEFNWDKWQIVVKSRKECRAIVLCTDGIADDIVSEQRIEFAKAFYDNYKSMNTHHRKSEISKWLTDWPVPGHVDDKTIVCLYNREEIE